MDVVESGVSSGISVSRRPRSAARRLRQRPRKASAWNGVHSIWVKHRQQWVHGIKFYILSYLLRKAQAPLTGKSPEPNRMLGMKALPQEEAHLAFLKCSHCGVLPAHFSAGVSRLLLQTAILALF